MVEHIGSATNPDWLKRDSQLTFVEMCGQIYDNSLSYIFKICSILAGKQCAKVLQFPRSSRSSRSSGPQGFEVQWVPKVLWVPSLMPKILTWYPRSLGPWEFPRYKVHWVFKVLWIPKILQSLTSSGSLRSFSPLRFPSYSKPLRDPQGPKNIMSRKSQ